MAAYVKYTKDNVEALKKAAVRHRLPRCGCGSSDLEQHEDPKEGVVVHCRKCSRTHTRRASLVVTIPLISKAVAVAREIERITGGAAAFLQDGTIEVREGGLFSGVLLERAAQGTWFRSDALRPEPQSCSPNWARDVEAVIEAFGSTAGRIVPVLPATVEVVAVDAEMIEGPLNRNTYRLPVAPNGKALRPATGPRIADLAPHLRLYEATHATIIVAAVDGRVGFQRVVGVVDPKTRVPRADPVRTPWIGALDRVPTGLKRAADAAVRAAKVVAAGGKVPGGAWQLLPAVAAIPSQTVEEQPAVETAPSGAIVLVQPALELELELEMEMDPEPPPNLAPTAPTTRALAPARVEVIDVEVIEAPPTRTPRPGGKRARKAATLTPSKAAKTNKAAKTKVETEEDKSDWDVEF